MLASEVGAIIPTKDPIFHEPVAPRELLVGKLPPIRNAYKAPNPFSKASEDDFDFEGFTPRKLEVSDSSTLSRSLHHEKDRHFDSRTPAHVLLAGDSCFGIDHIGRRLAEELEGELIDANLLHGEDSADSSSSELLQKVISRVETCQGSFVLINFPRDGHEAETFREELINNNLSITDFLLLEADEEFVLEKKKWIVDEDGEKVIDADYEENATWAAVNECNLKNNSIAQEFGSVCTSIDAEAEEDEVWERVKLTLSCYLTKEIPPMPDEPFLSPEAEKSPTSASQQNPFSEVEEKETSPPGKSAKLSVKERYDKTVQQEQEKKIETDIVGEGVPSAQINTIVEEGEEGGEEAEVEQDERPGVDDGGESDEAASSSQPWQGKPLNQEEIDRKMLEQAQRAWAGIEEQTLVDRSEEVQQGMVSEQSGKVLPTKVVKRDFLISFEEALDFFRHLDRSPYLDSIVTRAEAVGCMARFMEKVMGKKELSSPSLVDERELVFVIAKVAFGKGSYVSELEPEVIHLRMLQTIFSHVTGSKEPRARIGRHWEEIGFQGTDPATDLRDLGMLSMLLLLYASSNHLQKVKQVFPFASGSASVSDAADHGFPFSLLAISLSRICLEVLRSGGLTDAMNREQSVLDVLNTFFMGLLLEFFSHWRKNGLEVNRGDFQLALEHVEKKAQSRPASILKASRDPVWEPPADHVGGDPAFTSF